MGHTQTDHFNIVILPDAETAKGAIELSNKIAKTVDARLILGQKNTLPHLSLYQAHYPVGSLQTCIQTMETLLHTLVAPTIVLSGTSHFDEFIFWDAIKTIELQQLHEAILEAFNPIRQQTLGSNDLLALQSPTLGDIYKNNIQNYGYLLAYEQFQPHITISVTQTVQEAAMAVEHQASPVTSFLAEHIAITDIGKNGTVTQILHEWKLS